MVMGRPKAEIPRSERINLRLTKFEAEKISGISKKLNITKTEAILRGIDLLIAYKPKKYKSFAKNPKVNEPGVVRGNFDED